MSTSIRAPGALVMQLLCTSVVVMTPRTTSGRLLHPRQIHCRFSFRLRT